MGFTQFCEIIDPIGHKLTQMSIQEIGGGTGGATRPTLEVLSGQPPFRRYQDYTFTDIGTPFFAAVETKFSRYNYISYERLDIELEPLQQGLQSQYDLMISSQFLHATRSIVDTLKNVRTLCNTGGKLIIMESTKTTDFVTLTFGLFPCYWNGV